MELASSRLPISQLLLAISLSTVDSSWVPPLPTRTAVVSHRRCAAPAAADSGNISSAPRGGLRGLGGALRGAARSRSGATSGRGGRIAVAGGLLAALGLGGGAVAARRASRPLPVVLVHGILDCSENMYQVEAWVRASLGRGGHVLNVEIGNGVVDSIARPMDWQLQELAAAIRADPALAEGFNMIGYSQGALLARGYVQRYNLPRVSTLVSWVGPQAGQFGVPAWDEMIGHINKITSAMWYTPAIQERVSFANYWRDPMRLDTYRSNSAFLADLNNEAEDVEKRIHCVLRLCCAGHYSKGYGLFSASPLRDMTRAKPRDDVRALHPQDVADALRLRQLRQGGSPEVSDEALAAEKAKRHVAEPDYMRDEGRAAPFVLEASAFHKVMARVPKERAMFSGDALSYEELGRLYHSSKRARDVLFRLFFKMAAGRIHESLRPLLGDCFLVGLRKPDGGTRPIGIGSALRRLVGRCIMEQIKDEVGERLTGTAPTWEDLWRAREYNGLATEASRGRGSWVQPCKNAVCAMACV